MLLAAIGRNNRHRLGCVRVFCISDTSPSPHETSDTSGILAALSGADSADRDRPSVPEQAIASESLAAHSLRSMFSPLLSAESAPFVILNRGIRSDADRQTLAALTRIRCIHLDVHSMDEGKPETTMHRA